MLIRFEKDAKVNFRLSSRSPIQQGIIIKDSGLNRVWVQPQRIKGRYLKNDLRQPIAVSRRLVFIPKQRND